jgi:hypothetical protein
VYRRMLFNGLQIGQLSLRVGLFEDKTKITDRLVVVHPQDKMDFVHRG